MLLRMRPGGWAHAAVVLACTALCDWVALRVLGGESSFLLLWPVTAVGLALVLPFSSSRAERARLVVAFGLGMLLGSATTALPGWILFFLAGANALELWVGASLLRDSVTSFDDLKKLRRVGRFGLVALLCAVGRAELVTSPLVNMRDADHLMTWFRVVAADSLGTVILLPCLLYLASARRSARHFEPARVRWAAVLALLLAVVTVAAFYQRDLPLLFLVSPPLLALVFVSGTEGAVVGNLLVVVVGGWFTELGRGPISLVRFESYDARMLMFQFFVATVVALALPVGALLDERRRAELAVREGQLIYTKLLEHAEGMMVLLSRDGERRVASAAVTAVTGWSPEQFLAQGELGPVHASDQSQVQEFLRHLQLGEDRQPLRFRLLRQNGSYLWAEAVARSYPGFADGEHGGHVISIRDVSEQVQMEDAWSAERAAMAREQNRLATLAIKDELTGLLNRRGFNSQILFEMQRKDRTKAPLSLLLLDIDFFKQMNDKLGHARGDECLRAIGEVLRSATRRVTDTAARVGGEEFAVLLAATDAEGAYQVGQAIRQAVATLGIEHPGSSFGHLTVSVGTATIPSDRMASMEELLEAADRALYASKHYGRNRVSGGALVGRTTAELRGETA
ncbi:MAG TPA: diguanylate cyclase [Terracidiphilus sp.]|nr:diguanylate cyclase [Terracidiphilus sp.]